MPVVLKDEIDNTIRKYLAGSFDLMDRAIYDILHAGN